MNYGEFTNTGAPKTTNINSYRKAKLKIMKRDFCIDPTEEELAHADTLTTEVAIDQFCLGVINNRWG
jgi:hypothetical protein